MKLNFSALAKVFEKIDDTGANNSRCGNWRMALGGYDMGYEIYYKESPIGRVNYEDREYELYDDDFMTKDQIPEFLAAIDAKRFTDVGNHEQDDEFTDEEQDMIDESRNKMKFRKIVKKADEKPNPDFKSLDKATWEIGRTSDGKKQNESDSDNSASDHPRIYVSTYAKYNDGSIDGKWIDISEYNTYKEFVDACRELHKDEKDPEFMVQDFENYPEAWYHEAGLPTEEEFDKINNYYMMDDDRKAAYEAYVNYTDDDDIEHFEEAYQGHFDSASDFAYDFVDSIGWDGVGEDNLDMYFDYDALGRDLMYDFHNGDPDNTDSDGNPEDPDHYYDNDGYDMGEYESDEQVARDFIDGLGGVDQLGKETAQRYFDYDSFGRDLLINDYFEEDGYVFSRY